MTYIRFTCRFIFLGTMVGLIMLLAACGGTNSNQSESATNYTSSSQNASSTTTGSPTATVQVHNTPSSVVTVSQPTPQPTVAKAANAPAPTAAPLHTPIAATPTPKPIAPSGPLSLALACSGPNAQDGFSVTNTHAKACVYTSAGASLTISVNFCNGTADSSSALQGTFTANNSGFYEWDWTPKASCHPISSWSVTVNAQLSGQTASVSSASSVS